VAAHVSSQSPWVFRFAKYLIKRRYRGGFRLLDAAARLGLLNTVVRYPLSPVITLGVPLYRPENQFDRDELLIYEHDVICAVVRRLRAYDGPVVMCDCGADIGLFSALVLAKLPSISTVIAFEPNPHAYEILKDNFDKLPVRATAYQSAVGRAHGRGRLVEPDYDRGAHAAFVEPCADGEVVITTIDSLAIDAANVLLLKIDVEGFELEVIEGAVETLRCVKAFVATIEAHRNVVRRTGIDTTSILRRLQSIRTCSIEVAEAPHVALELHKRFFDQVPDRLVYNLVVSSADA
jgi:FkbM family methyltransferase